MRAPLSGASERSLGCSQFEWDPAHTANTVADVMVITRKISVDWGIGNRQMGGQFNYLKEGGAGGSAAQSVDCFSNLHEAWG